MNDDDDAVLGAAVGHAVPGTVRRRIFETAGYAAEMIQPFPDKFFSRPRIGAQFFDRTGIAPGDFLKLGARLDVFFDLRKRRAEPAVTDDEPVVRIEQGEARRYAFNGIEQLALGLYGARLAEFHGVADIGFRRDVLTEYEIADDLTVLRCIGGEGSAQHPLTQCGAVQHALEGHGLAEEYPLDERLQAGHIIGAEHLFQLAPDELLAVAPEQLFISLVDIGKAKIAIDARDQDGKGFGDQSQLGIERSRRLEAFADRVGKINWAEPDN